MVNGAGEKRAGNVEFADRVWNMALFFFMPLRELWYGIASNRLPWSECLFAVTLVIAAINIRLDFRVLKWLGVSLVYPRNPVLYWSYFSVLITSPFWFWGLVQAGRRRKLVERLSQLFTEAGLVTRLGKLPGFVFDKPVDEFTRKLRIAKKTIALPDFQKARPALESELRIYVDEMRDNREHGTLDVIYSHYPMPESVTLTHIPHYPRFKYLVGSTRSKQITATLPRVPHLLVAGQTGAGKSTFLRQIITTLYLNNSDAKFTLIDLKGGLEFQLFDNTKRIEVMPDIERAIEALEDIGRMLVERMELLRSHHCKDLEAYVTKVKEEGKSVSLSRQVVVVDEAAEMFLAGGHATSGDILKARRILSQVARQGRSVGVHLIVATQRPDSRSLDPQVKANLTGVLCFQMQNDSSSILVIGNGRATDLPPVPGCAIWKCGLEMVEVQTPLLDPNEVENLLKDHRKATKKTAI